MATAEKTQYETFADKYNSFGDLPTSRIEGALVTAALGDCTGLKVLDIGGGNGLHARKAVNAGAEVVDLVDVSPAMIEVGEKIEAELGRQDKIRWYIGDATQPFDKIPLEKDGYDIVLVGWTFDHATSPKELEDMWKNVQAHCKPGGKLVNIRVTEYEPEYLKRGKYGIYFDDYREIPGGIRYMVNYLTKQPFAHEGTSMKESYSLSNEIAHRHGFSDLHVIPPGDTDVAKKDPEFWKEFIEHPNFVVVTATKV